MNTKIKIALAVLGAASIIAGIVFAAYSFLPSPQSDKLPDSVAAETSNGHKITSDEVAQYIQGMKDANDWDDEQWNQYLTEAGETHSSFESKVSTILAKRHILRQWAEEENIEMPSEDAIQHKMEEDAACNDVLVSEPERRENACDELLIVSIASAHLSNRNSEGVNSGDADMSVSALAHINNMAEEMNGKKEISIFAFPNREAALSAQASNNFDGASEIIYEGFENMGTFPDVLADATSLMSPNSVSDIIEHDGQYYLISARDAVIYPEGGFAILEEVPPALVKALGIEGMALSEEIGNIRRELDERLSASNLVLNIPSGDQE